MNDRKIFANSLINKMLRNWKIPTTFQTVIPGCEKIPNYLIGEPVDPFLHERNWSAINQVECLFGRLKT